MGFFKELRWQYSFTGFASGPDTIAGLLWLPAILYLAERDQLCGAVDGRSSGADGQLCMQFNATKFLESGGQACIASDALFDTPRYVPDYTLPGCEAAFISYRARTSPSFTCDCQGDHAFLGGTDGLRSGTVFILSNVIATVIIGIVAPGVGTWIDFHGGKKVWGGLLVGSGVGALCMAIMGSGYVWLVALVIQILTVIVSELLTIPRQAYLDDIKPWAEDMTFSSAIAAVGGYRTAFSYGAQIIFVVYALIISFVTPSVVTLAIVVTLTAGIWILLFYGYTMYKMPRRAASRTKTPGQSLCDVAYGQLFRDLSEMWATYPEAVKYLLLLFVMQNGLGTTVLTIAVNYLLEQLRFTAFQTQVVFLAVLISGVFWLLLFSRVVVKRLSQKKILLILLCVWIVSILLVGLGFRTPADENALIFPLFIVASVIFLAPGLTWYYSIYYAAFVQLVPADRVNAFTGVFTSVRTIALIVQPLIYAACSQAFPSARTGRQVGLLTVGIWDIIAIPLLLWIDFGKGARDAAKSDDSKEYEKGPAAGDTPVSAA